MKEPRYRKEDAKRKVFRHSKDNPKNIAYVQREKEEKPPNPLPENLMSEKKEFVNTVELLNNPKLYAYIRRALKKEYGANRLSEKRLKKIIRIMFKIISGRILNNDAGVYIRKFGYFCVMRHPQRRKSKWRGRRTYFHSKGFAYSPIFIPIRKDIALRSWVMYRTFYPYNIISKMKKMLRNGKQYKMNFSLLYNANANRRKTLDVIKIDND